MKFYVERSFLDNFPFSCYDGFEAFVNWGDSVKKPLIRIFVCLLLLIPAVFLLPIPHHYDVSLFGYNPVTGQDNIPITVEGWEYRYILKDDQIRADITVINSDGTVTDWTTIGPLDPWPDETVDFVFGQVYRYNAQKNSMEFARFSFTPNMEAFLLQNDDYLCLLASQNANSDPQELLRLFHPSTE